MDEPSYSGGCLCGAVRYRVEGEPLRVAICHCRTCRRNTGAPFAAFVIYRRERFTLLEGALGRHASSARITRCFCPRCGSPVVSEEGPEVNITLGTLDEPERFTPDYELWTLSRLPWVAAPADREAFERDRDGPATVP